MLENVQNRHIEDWMWNKILEKMYEQKDAILLQENIRQVIERRNRDNEI